MVSFYFKHKHKYINGECSKEYLYIEIRKAGKIISISRNKMAISFPKSFTFRSDFETITKEEFEKIKQEIES